MPKTRIALIAAFSSFGMVILIVIIGAIVGDDHSDNQTYTHTLLDDQYSSIADRLTRKAETLDWCYKHDGSLDSRDLYILIVHAEEIVTELTGESVLVEDTKLTGALLQAGWTRFIGPDYDRGGTEYRYRPPGCG